MKKKTQPTTQIKLCNIQIQFSVFVLAAISVLLGFWKLLAAAYAVTALHEYAHISVARRLGLKIKNVGVFPFGINMKLSENIIANPDDELKTAAAGPVASLLTACAAYALPALPCREFIITASLAAGLFNLLPVLPLDGGRILRAVTVKKYGCIKANSYCEKISKAGSFLITALGVYFFYRTGFNFSLILAGAFLTANLTEERKNANFTVMKDILYSRKKLSDGKIPKTEFLAVAKNEDPLKILGKLSYDKYHLIGVVDEQMKISHILTETELIEKIVQLRL